MGELKKEYRDMKNIRHKVEHFFVSPEDLNAKERNKKQTVQELYQVLTKLDR